jgi:hypothetical protein
MPMNWRRHQVHSTTFPLRPGLSGSRAASGNLPPERKRNDRRGGEGDHQPGQGNRCRYCENGESLQFFGSMVRRHVGSGLVRVDAGVALNCQLVAQVKAYCRANLVGSSYP